MSYRLVVIDRNAHPERGLRGLPSQELADADVVIGKNRTVLKHRYLSVGRRLTEREVEDIKEEAEEVRER
jgi:hypothetical protein